MDFEMSDDHELWTHHPDPDPGTAEATEVYPRWIFVVAVPIELSIPSSQRLGARAWPTITDDTRGIHSLYSCSVLSAQNGSMKWPLPRPSPLPELRSTLFEACF